MQDVWDCTHDGRLVMLYYQLTFSAVQTSLSEAMPEGHLQDKSEEAPK